MTSAKYLQSLFGWTRDIFPAKFHLVCCSFGGGWGLGNVGVGSVGLETHPQPHPCLYSSSSLMTSSFQLQVSPEKLPPRTPTSNRRKRRTKDEDPNLSTGQLFFAFFTAKFRSVRISLFCLRIDFLVVVVCMIYAGLGYRSLLYVRFLLYCL